MSTLGRALDGRWGCFLPLQLHLRFPLYLFFNFSNCIAEECHLYHTMDAACQAVGGPRTAPDFDGCAVTTTTTTATPTTTTGTSGCILLVVNKVSHFYFQVSGVPMPGPTKALLVTSLQSTRSLMSPMQSAFVRTEAAPWWRWSTVFKVAILMIFNEKSKSSR